MMQNKDSAELTLENEYHANHPEGKYDYLCKVCQRSRDREYYRRNIEKRKAAYREYKKTEQGKAVSKKSNYAAKERYPEKYRAKQKLRYAVIKGKIIKQICEVCGEKKVEAHHYLGYDPSHWYDVQWLCHDHHRDAHKFSLRSRELVA
jgi:hypothetical protein